MDQSESSLVALYVAGLSGIGYGLRQIIEVQAGHGAPVRRIVISGGAGQDDLVRQILADTSGLSVVASEAAEPCYWGRQYWAPWRPASTRTCQRPCRP
jgi:D-ribulokinase